MESPNQVKLPSGATVHMIFHVKKSDILICIVNQQQAVKTLLTFTRQCLLCHLPLTLNLCYQRVNCQVKDPNVFV